VPQFLPSAVHVEGVHGPKQDVASQICPEGHDPHWMMPPQPSERGPQAKPCEAQVSGVHDPVPQDVAPQVCPEGQDPHWMMLPQLSERGPQAKPCEAHVTGTQGIAPQVVAPQVCPEGHDPHWMMPPQPSERNPQEKPCAAHVSGVHARAVLGANQATPARNAVATPARYRCFILFSPAQGIYQERNAREVARAGRRVGLQTCNGFHPEAAPPLLNDVGRR
jgi:hypothetical protein